MYLLFIVHAIDMSSYVVCFLSSFSFSSSYCRLNNFKNIFLQPSPYKFSYDLDYMCWLLTYLMSD